MSLFNPFEKKKLSKIQKEIETNVEETKVKTKNIMKDKYREMTDDEIYYQLLVIRKDLFGKE